MRLAVVVAPQRFVPPARGTAPDGTDLTGALTEVLTRGGHRVVRVTTSVDLESDFDRALGGLAPSDELVVYLAARTSTRTDEVTLQLDDEGRTTMALRVISDAVLAREPSGVLVIVDASHDGDPDDPILAAEHVDALVRALDARDRGFGAMVGVSPGLRATDPWTFTRQILTALDHTETRDDRGAVTTSLLQERLRSMEDTRVQSTTFVRGRAESVLIEPPDVVRVAATLRASIRPHAALSPAPSPPAPRAMEPSLPPFEPLLELAEGAFSRGSWDEALAGYKAALMVAPAGDARVRASLYVRIGEVKRAQGKPREAELNYEKALGAQAGHRGALDALVELAVASGEARRAIEWRRKRLRTLERQDERVLELRAIAAAHGDALNDARAEAEALEEAHVVDPRDQAVLESLRAAYERQQRWPRVVEVLEELADLGTDERGALRFAAADVALGRLRDEDRGLALLERALDDDPTHERALHALVAVRTSRGEWRALDAAYARLVDRFAKLGDVELAWDTCRKLGTLRRDKTRDIPGAIEAFAGAVSCKPGDVDSRAMLAEMHLADGDEAAAVAEFERIAQHAPTRASTYARLFALHQRAGRADRAWLAGLALEELGAADMDQQLVVDQFRIDGPIRPSRSLDDAAWDELMRAPGADDVVASVLGAVVDAAAAARVDELRAAKKLVTLDPARRQSAASTVSAVRSFQWAAQVLGVDVPELYVLDGVPGGIAAAQVATPSTALGPDVVRGLTAKDLAFLAGRHLTYYRREHYALVLYPTLGELSALFLGAVKLAMPALPVPQHLEAAVARRRKALARHVEGAAKDRLAEAVKRLDARDGRVDLSAWIRSVELTAHRAGLLLCGDLRVAIARLRADDRTIAELTLDQKRGDLLSYCASERLARARALLSVEAHTSVQPPPHSERQVG
jgi:tetratricopeptide (TPR) repeat protein